LSALFIDPEDGQIRPGSEAAALVELLIAPARGHSATVLALLGEHGIPAGAVHRLLERSDAAVAASIEWVERVAADRARAQRIGAAAVLADRALATFGGRAAIVPSTLGPMWSSDVDVLVSEAGAEDAARCLREAGLLEVDPLLERLGRLTPGVSRFAAVEKRTVLAAVELCRYLYDYGPAADSAVARAERRAGATARVAAADRLTRRAAKLAAARRVTLRGVLELIALVRETGIRRPPTAVVAIALRRASAFQRDLGADSELPAASALGSLPNVWWGLARARAVRREVVHRGRPRRVRVAFSGVDGAGKSTQVSLLSGHLDALNVPAVEVWVRLGFSGSRLLSIAAKLGQRLLPAGSHSAHLARATASGNATPVTRRGPLGWLWALAVTLDYVRCSRAAARALHGQVGIFDRSSLDASIALDYDYGGTLRLRLQHRLIDRLVPKPDHGFYLRLAGPEAYARKEDMFSRGALEELVSRYDRGIAARSEARALDARRAPEELAWEVLAVLLSGGPPRSG
jgi:thymidylate kinase